MAIVASGQITIVDLNDSRQLQLFIGCSQPRTQIYNPNDSVYIPDWTIDKPTLTPQLFVAGNSTDIISSANSIKWYEGTSLITNGGNYTIPTSGVKTLTINNNILANRNTQLFVCEVTYTDSTTGTPVTLRADFEFVKVSNGSDGSIGEDGERGQDAVNSVVWTPNGNMIKNSTGTLTAKCDVYSGSTTVTPSEFKWYIQDPTATTSNGGDSDGGAGWRLLTSSTNYGIAGYTTHTITIPASAIDSLESFKCVATYNSVKYSDVCTVVDVSDPLSVIVVGSSIFRNGEGTTSLLAKVYRDGEEIDTNGTTYIYTWSLYDLNGTQNTSFGTNGIKTGKSITVDASDVDGTGNLICEID